MRTKLLVVDAPTKFVVLALAVRKISELSVGFDNSAASKVLQSIIVQI